MSDGRRLPRLTRGRRTTEQQELFILIADGPRGRGTVAEDGALTGAFNAMLQQVRIGAPLQQLGLAVQQADDIGPALREAAILTVVNARRCSPEWETHRPRGLAAGLSETDIDAIRGGLPVDAAHSSEVKVGLDLTRALLAHDSVDDATFARAEGELGLSGLLQLIALVGYYDLLSSIFRTFDIE